MRISKRKMFFLLNGAIAFGLLLYFGFWMLCPKTTGTIQHPLSNSTIMKVIYKVQNKSYTATLLRSGIPFLDTEVLLHYNKWNPAQCRIYSYMGLFAEPLAWWLVFLLATAILLLTNNSVYSKGTVFILQKKRPYILMEEFFPARKWWQPGRDSKTRGTKEEKKKWLE